VASAYDPDSVGRVYLRGMEEEMEEEEPEYYWKKEEGKRNGQGKGGRN